MQSSSRLSTHQDAWGCSSGIVRRPCLPRAELLDGRVLLSATPASETAPGATQAVVALLQGEVNLVSDELTALSLVTSAAGTQKIHLKFTNPTLNKVGDAFAELDSGIYKLGDAVIQGFYKLDGGAEGHKLDQALKIVADAEQKIGLLTSDFGGSNGDNPLGPALQKIQADATSLVDSLLRVAPQPGTLSDQTADALQKITGDFRAIDDDILVLASDTSAAKQGATGNKGGKPIEKIQLNFTKVKVEYARINDPSLRQTILGALDETIALVPDLGGGQLG